MKHFFMILFSPIHKTVLDSQIISKEMFNISVEFSLPKSRYKKWFKIKLLTLSSLIELKNSKTFYHFSHIQYLAKTNNSEMRSLLLCIASFLKREHIPQPRM